MNQFTVATTITFNDDGSMKIPIHCKYESDENNGGNDKPGILELQSNPDLILSTIDKVIALIAAEPTTTPPKKLSHLESERLSLIANETAKIGSVLYRKKNAELTSIWTNISNSNIGQYIKPNNVQLHSRKPVLYAAKDGFFRPALVLIGDSNLIAVKFVRCGDVQFVPYPTIIQCEEWKLDTPLPTADQNPFSLVGNK